MNSFNVCSFIGRVPTHEAFKPVYMPGDEQQQRRARYSATISVRRDRKKEGDKYYPEDLIRFTAWGPTADFLNKYAPQGTTIAITGSLNVDTVKGEDGSKHTYHTIMVDSARIVYDSNSNNNSERQNAREEETVPQQPISNPFQKSKTTNPATAISGQSATSEAPVARFNPFNKGTK